MSWQVGLLRETRAGEKRVMLLPDAVAAFTAAGFTVLVERGAGERSGHSDADYRKAGGTIVSTEDAWACPYVIKYKAPSPEEARHFRSGLHLASYMHAEGDRELTRRMQQGGITAYACEFFRTPEGTFPMSVSDSEISGKLAVLYGAWFLQSHLGGRGVLLAGVPGAEPARVVVIGYGNAGAAAARLAAAMGADVTVFGTDPLRLRRFQAGVPANVRCLLNTPEALTEAVTAADLVIGAILISTYDTPPMIDRTLLRQMRRGAVVVDVTCGYGAGYFPTFHRQTTHAEPVYEVEGILHVKIDAMPACVPLTAAAATSHNVARYLIDLGRAIYQPGFADPTSAAGKVVEAGAIVHPEVRRNFDLMPAA